MAHGLVFRGFVRGQYGHVSGTQLMFTLGP